MSDDSFTEVTNQSWFSRIGNAFKGIFVGLILFVVAFPLLFWNEGRAVKRYKTLNEGAGIVVTVSADTVDSAQDGKLVHTTGTAETADILEDPTFGVSANALKLKRVVEMYQWEEDEDRQTKKKVGGGTTTKTTYSYHRTWSSSLISSSGFHRPDGHRNPDSMPYSSQTWTASPVHLEAYTLSSSLLGKINAYQPLPVESGAEAPDDMQIHNSGFYQGANPSSPEIGDLRIQFKHVPATQVSVVSKQVADTFEPYTSKTGGSLELLEIGTHSAEEMFAQAHASNRMLTWLIRGGGFLLMWIGLGMVLKPLSVIADVLPILGNIVGAGAGLIAGLVAAVCSLVTIAVAWVVYRPVLGIALLVVAGVLLFLARTKLKKATPPPAAAGA